MLCLRSSAAFADLCIRGAVRRKRSSPARPRRAAAAGWRLRARVRPGLRPAATSSAAGAVRHHAGVRPSAARNRRPRIATPWCATDAICTRTLTSRTQYGTIVLYPSLLQSVQFCCPIFRCQVHYVVSLAERVQSAWIVLRPQHSWFACSMSLASVTPRAFRRRRIQFRGIRVADAGRPQEVRSGLHLEGAAQVMCWASRIGSCRHAHPGRHLA